MVEEGDVRILPQNELDFNMLTTNGVWGKDEVPKELRDRLSRHFVETDQQGNAVLDEHGNAVVTTRGLWGLLGYYTRDMRLGNLGKDEVEFCQYYLELANDYLEEDMIRPFLIALSRVAARLELSQSKGGFLRRQLNTLIQEHHSTDNTQQKKSLFGMMKGGSK